MRVILAALAACTLAGCEAPSPATNYDLVLLKCDGGTTAEGKCVKIDRVGAELAFLVNPQNQQVQITIVSDPDHDWFGRGTSMVHDCKVVDARNWDCDAGDGIRTTYTMARGHFYSATVGGPPPDYYSTGITGWRRWGLKLGALTPREALDYE